MEKMLKNGVKDIRNEKETLEQELRNILQYWIDKMTDHKNGGFYGRRDQLDQLMINHDKGVILNTRILWTFSRAARFYKEEVYSKTAERAFHYILDYFIDYEHGGVFWMLDYKGRPVETKKQIYAQAFAIYALSEYYLLSGNETSLREAVNLFHLIEKYSFDKSYNGYLEAFDRKWNLLEDLRLSEKDANEKKTMNTHLHILEAYTNLLQAWKDPLLEAQLKNLIILFKEKFVKNNSFYLFFDEEWNSKSDEISFGHDIEGSWLLCEAVKMTGDKHLWKEIESLAVNMVDKTLRYALDDDGGLMNEANSQGLTDTDKHWWPQAEALVGLVNAWQITGQEKYLAAASKVWKFILHRLVDKENGEWHWKTNHKGEVIFNEDKAGPWKCPYHNTRGIIELLERLK